MAFSVSDRTARLVQVPRADVYRVGERARRKFTQGVRKMEILAVLRNNVVNPGPTLPNDSFEKLLLCNGT